MHRHPGGEAALERLISAAGLAPGAHIIDLGAGDGGAVRYLRSLGFDAVGIDLKPGSDVEYGDILSPPFEPESFDAALSLCSLLLTGDVPLALRRTRTLLRPGGVFMYSDVVPGGLTALAELVREAGFELISCSDETEEWRGYYIAALWRGEAEPPPPDAKNCRYLAAILRKEEQYGRI